MTRTTINMILYTADNNFKQLPTFAVYGTKAQIGNQSREYQKCQAHVNMSGKATYSSTVVLHNGAFLAELYANGMVKAIRSAEHGIYAEFQNMKGNKIRCKVYEKGNNIRISFSKSVPSDYISKAVALSIMAIASRAECERLFEDIINDMNIESIYTFCDSVLYEYLKAFEDVECDNAMSVEEVQQAARTGEYSAFSIFDNPMAGLKTRAKSKEKKKEELPMIDEYKNGYHKIRYEWSDKQKERVIPPSFLDTFVPIPEFFKLMRKLDVRVGQNMVANWEYGFTGPEEIRKDVVNVLLYGNPGTGKTILAHALSAATGMPLYEVKFDKYTESDEVEGKNKIIEGKIAFTETDFLEGYEHGGILLLEEINCADQNMITGVLNNAIEYPFFITKNGYEKINRHPFTVIIATMNVGTEGTMWLNQAFASRFKQKYHMADPSKEDFIRFLTNYGYDDSHARYVHNAYEKVLAYLTSSRATAEYAVNLSTRACLGALENISEGEDPKTAIMDTIVGSIGIVDPATAENVCKNVITNLPDYK